MSTLYKGKKSLYSYPPFWTKNTMSGRCFWVDSCPDRGYTQITVSFKT